jgi:NAD(P)-dependent dehydrogenase (short-subunit alcohol dehydrogenase family)
MMTKKTNVYVITGGAGGMGQAVARRLGKQGTMLLTDIDSSRLEQVAAQLRSEGLRIEAQAGDIADDRSVRSLAQAAASHGRLAGLVHTAGISTSVTDWKRIFKVDLVGTALLLKEFLPLAEHGIAAVCVASMSGHLVKPKPELEAILSDPLNPGFFESLQAFPGTNNHFYAYALAKRGVILLCEVLAPAWGERGARLVSISPGIIETPMSKQEFEIHPTMKDMVAMTPLKRTGQPEEIAAAAEFLLSDNASFITGTDLRVDGGCTPTYQRPKKT